MESNYNPLIKITRTRNVKMPMRGSEHAAGWDMYIPEYDESWADELYARNKSNKLFYQTYITDDGSTGLEIIIAPNRQVIIPSGIRVCIEDVNTYLDVCNRSGVATKLELLRGAHVIDADYRGEIFYNLHNVGAKKVVIRTGERVCQMIHKQKLNTEWQEITPEEFETLTTERGEGGLGHSGMK